MMQLWAHRWLLQGRWHKLIVKISWQWCWWQLAAADIAVQDLAAAVVIGLGGGHAGCAVGHGAAKSINQSILINN